jgi:diguanylate cyclase (GGDEF)-like protein
MVILSGSHDGNIVAISVAVAMLVSYTALNLANRVATNRRNAAGLWWLTGGALAMGIGIWSMHFIGMLAFRLPIALGYDIWLTLLSLLVAVGISAFALWEVSLPQLSIRRLMMGAGAMGSGIAAMHYIGMASLRMAPGVSYDPLLFALSLLIAMTASAAALWIAFRLRENGARRGALRAVAAAAMGLAIAGMHYTGMAAARFAPDSICMAASGGFSSSWLLTVIVIGTLGVLVIALLTSVLARVNEELAQQALHDGLTKLPNRMLFEDRLEQAIQRAMREQRRVALMFIDLDGFKEINDGLGHDVGDVLLIEVARSIKGMLRGRDTVARLGGDEFVVLIDMAAPEDAAQVAQKLVTRIAQPFSIQSHLLHVTASIGIAVYPEDGGTSHEMLVNADAAMYHTKRSGRNGYHFFARSMNVNARNHLLLLHEMRHAIEHNEFVLHYQPKFAAVSGKVLGAEALVRWQHPQRGLMLPDQFIALAERSGLIVALGEWVLDSACAQMRRWIALGHKDWKIAVNVSAVQFAHEKLPEIVERTLARHSLPPQCLTLEVTESTAMDDVEVSMITLNKIAALGVDISIDDFGTGYSSLLYLKRLSVNELKIDQGFVRNFGRGADDSATAAIVAAVVSLGHALNLRVVAEGVETEAQRSFLDAAGCDALQGFLLAHPMPAEQFIEVVNVAKRPAATAPYRGSSGLADPAPA